MIRLTPVFALAFCAGLAACQTPSPELRAFRALEGEEQLDYARVLPLQERLDLYHAVYSVRRHPRDSSLSLVFDNEGQAGFDAAMGRMVSRATFYEYVWVLKAIDRGGSLDLCEPGHKGRIRRRAADVGLLPPDLSYITFRTCALVEEAEPE